MNASRRRSTLQPFLPLKAAKRRVVEFVHIVSKVLLSKLGRFDLPKRGSFDFPEL